jgi:citrate synthase
MEEGDGAVPARLEHRDEGGRRDRSCLAISRARAPSPVAGGSPGQESSAENEARLGLEQDEGAVRQLAEPGLVEAAFAGLRIEPLLLKLGVYGVRADLSRVKTAPDLREADVVLASAEGARAVPGRERRRLVEEEELGEQSRLEERPPLPALELEPAGDPTFGRKAPADSPGRVVQAATVPVDEPVRGVRDQLAERRDAVLEGHSRRVRERHARPAPRRPVSLCYKLQGRMQIGKADPPVTHIARAYPDRVEVRGRDLTGDVMGRLSFTEYFHLLLTGEEATEEQRFFLDLLLVSIAEHGMMPSNAAARMTLAADPESLQGAVAAGILGAGPVVLGTADECARWLEVLRSSNHEPVDWVHGMRAAGARIPGFGHPVHRPVDPRAERILELADERGASGEHVALARRVREVVAEEYAKPLPMNVSLPIAAVMLDLGFSSDAVKSVPILARAASLLAHLAEEREEPIGFALARAAEEAVEYEPDARA